MLWLRQKIDQYIDGRPDKALKRAMPLCRILRLSSLSERILKFASTRHFQTLARQNVADELRISLGRLPPAIKVQLSDPDVECASSCVSSAASECRAILSEIIEAYEAILT